MSHKTHLHHHIPVVDLSKLSKPHTHDDFLFEILKLSQACEDWGFFQVKFMIFFFQNIVYLSKSYTVIYFLL